MRQVLAALAGLALLGGCGDPLRDVERLGDVPVADAAAGIAAAPADSAGAPGFLGQLFGGAAATPPGPADTDGTVPDASTNGAPIDATGLTPDTADDALLAVTAPAPAPRGFLRGLFGGAPAAPAGDAAVTPTSTQPTVAPGAVLPYGQMASACGLTALGSEVGRAGGFSLYDSAPGSTGLRSHFITGFDDGCPRQFSAALALFGDPLSHELVRYLPGAQQRPYSPTDTAYEQIKADVCGSPSGQPCGNRIERLARSLAFVTVYATFGTNAAWSEVLLYDGDVAATAFEGG